MYFRRYCFSSVERSMHMSCARAGQDMYMQTFKNYKYMKVLSVKWESTHSLTPDRINKRLSMEIENMVTKLKPEQKRVVIISVALLLFSYVCGLSAYRFFGVTCPTWLTLAMCHTLLVVVGFWLIRGVIKERIKESFVYVAVFIVAILLFIQSWFFAISKCMSGLLYFLS